MGCCCSASEEEKEAANTSIREALLQRRQSSHLDHVLEYGVSDKGLTVNLLRACNLPGTGLLKKDCDPYVKLYISDDPKKRQRSVGKASCKNPVWSPAQMFQFMPILDSKVDSLSLIVNVMDKDMIGKDEHLGDGRVRLKGIEDECLKKGGAVRKKVPLFTLSGDPVKGCFVELDLDLTTANKAHATEEEKLYEYERWDVVHGWSSEHLLGTDPGRWSTFDCKLFGDDMDPLILPLEKGWRVETDWEITGNEKSPHAWEYSIGFRAPSWFDEQNLLVRVRRRIWRRIVVDGSKMGRLHTDSVGTGSSTKADSEADDDSLLNSSLQSLV
jgi:hypothetical protein